MRSTLLATSLVCLALISGEATAGKSSYNSSSTITYNNVSYKYSSSSTCVDGTAALRLYRKWWCPVTATAPVASTDPVVTEPAPAPTPVLYSAQLSWTIPSTRADGTPLTASELAGYEVYYTNDSGSITATVPVSGGTTAAATVPSLASGSYYFSISAIDSTGLKSALSPVAAVTFP